MNPHTASCYQSKDPASSTPACSAQSRCTQGGADASAPVWVRGFHLIRRCWCALTHTLDATQPLAALLARAYVAHAFFLSGLTKIRDWDTTLSLFQEEYHVPLLPPELAAVMGTTGELALPVLLVLGLGSRFAALGLSVVNVMAVLSLSDIAPAALSQHVLWGCLLAGVAIYGGGPWGLERWVLRRACSRC